MDLLQQNPEALCQWLQQNEVDPSHVIAMAGDILTANDYKSLIKIADNGEQIRHLLNIVIRKPREDRVKFLQMLQQHFPPIARLLLSSSQGLCHQSVCAEEGSNVVTPLVSHTKTGSVNMDVTLKSSSGPKASDRLDTEKSQNHSACGQAALPDSLRGQFGTTSNVKASGGSNIFSPVFTHSNITDGITVNIKMESGSSEVQGLPKKTPGHLIKGSPKLAEQWAASIPDKMQFLQTHHSNLVKCVKNVDSIMDILISRGLHSEMASNIRALRTAEEKMRKILLEVGRCSETMAQNVVLALYECQQDLMEELLRYQQA